MSEKEKKIGMVVLSYFPADPRVKREAESLSDAGMFVDILCLRNEDEDKFYSYDNIKTYRIMSGTEQKESISKYLLMSILFSFVAFVRLTGLYFKKRYDLIQIHNMPDYLVFVALICKLFGVPVVFDLHDLSVELFGSKWKGKKSKILTPIVRYCEKLACGFSNALITTSTGFKSKLVERGIKAEKITLILNTADERIFNPELIQKKNAELSKDTITLLYHGTVAERFGLHIAIDAAVLLMQKIPNVHLNIYGKYDPSYKLLLEDLVVQKNLDRIVSLNGYISPEEIVTVVSESDFGIVPYISDPFIDLALSTKTFEYIKMSCPIVASRIPSTTSLFDDNCIWYFESGDAAGLANQIFMAINNPQLRQDKVLSSQKVYEKYNWSVMSDRYQKLITSLVV